MTNVLANIFGASPVMPLEKHIETTHRCARQLRPLFEAVIAGDWESVGRVKAEIDTIENEADDLKNEIRQHLPKSLFMPVPRQDLLELLLVQDKIANLAKDVAGIVVLRQMQIPEALAEPFLEYLDRVLDSTKQARKSVRELDELFTTGFRGREAELVESMIAQLDAIESDTDQHKLKLSRRLFEMEASLNPVDTMFLYKMIDLVGNIADMAERVGRRLELLLSH
ncbi:MAG: TIGR00153 family protein [Woeseiaceae bacterium]|nr:TIGR00153 family protein [Woeseiaceae bacterium]